ncbi:MAG: YxiJ family protein [Solibacillus sp.]
MLTENFYKRQTKSIGAPYAFSIGDEGLAKATTRTKAEAPFPYEAMRKIKQDFQTEFLALPHEGEFFTCDFNTYCMTVCGTLSYVIRGKQQHIPKWQRDALAQSFFEAFPAYQIFEHAIARYPAFYEEYTPHEQTRKLLLQLLK